jgi:hypothetical protein
MADTPDAGEQGAGRVEQAPGERTATVLPAQPPPGALDPAPEKVTHGQAPPAKQVTLDQITAQTAPRASSASERVLQVQIGGMVAVGMVVIILIVLCLIAGYAWFSRPPSFQDLVQTLGNDKALEAYKQVQTSWFSNIKDLIQILLVSLLVPFLTTVIAFIFGRQVGATDSGSGDAKT